MKMIKDSKQTEKTGRQKQAKVLRLFRKIHKVTGSLTFVIFFFVSVTGLLLGWKKHTGGAILPKTHKGVSSELRDWMPLDSLKTLAVAALAKQKPELSTEVDRIDVRPDKGVLKFSFVEHYWEVQLDCTTGKVLHIEKRYSDLLEQIHDGSIIDRIMKIPDDWFKLTYTNIAGWALLIFTITGFWLWYGPKVMRRNG